MFHMFAMTIATTPSGRAATITLLSGLACLALCGAATPARADARLNGHYDISMIGVTIGHITWTTDIAAGGYKTTANGKASGALSMLVNGEGQIATNGTIAASSAANATAGAMQLSPSFFTSNVVEDGETTGLQMTFDKGSVKTLRIDAASKQRAREDGRVPVTEADRQNVSDPLTAMLIGTTPDANPLTPAVCDRLLEVFDGQRRYNLALWFKRIDRVKVDVGYAGPVLVCGVMLKPIAGYRADSMLVKYAGGKRDMEIWFAPMANTPLVAPVRLVMPTLIGTLEIEADRFETIALKPSPANPADTPASSHPTTEGGDAGEPAR